MWCDNTDLENITFCEQQVFLWGWYFKIGWIQDSYIVIPHESGNSNLLVEMVIQGRVQEKQFYKHFYFKKSQCISRFSLKSNSCY